MASVSFRMSGSGSWQNLLPDEPSQRLYAEIYPQGALRPSGGEELSRLIDSWERSAIVRIDNQRIIPLGPIMTDGDLNILDSWFRGVSGFMVEAVLERLDDYRALALNLAGGKPAAAGELENILTIQICAHTLDSWVFTLLRRDLVGVYPYRDFAGDFFFWGYAFARGPQRIFGFTTYGGRGSTLLHVIRSHGMDREDLKGLLRRRDVWDCLQSVFASEGLDRGPSSRPGRGSYRDKRAEEALIEAGILRPGDPPGLAIPVFHGRDMEMAARLYQDVSDRIINYMTTGLDDLRSLIGECSFAACSWPDVMCMLFHLSYSFAADKLVEEGVIPDFPQSARGEWGVWIH